MSSVFKGGQCFTAYLRRFSSSESTTGGDDFKRPSEREALPFRTCVFKPKGSLLEGAGMELSAKLTEGVLLLRPPIKHLRRDEHRSDVHRQRGKENRKGQRGNLLRDAFAA